MDAFETKHNKIIHYFNTGKGIDLQYLDSQMAEKVMLHFAKMGYPALPMHDSFILHHGLEKELKEQMHKAFRHLFGVECKIDLKYNTIEERQKEHELEKKREDIAEDDIEADPHTLRALRHVGSTAHVFLCIRSLCCGTLGIELRHGGCGDGGYAKLAERVVSAVGGGVAGLGK